MDVDLNDVAQSIIPPLTPIQSLSITISKSERSRLKRNGLHLAGESKIKKTRLIAANDEGLEATCEVINNVSTAFIIDPIKRINTEISYLLRLANSQINLKSNLFNDHITVIGDTGGSYFSFGVQLVGRNNPQSSHSFIPLCLYQGKEDYKTISACCNNFIQSINSNKLNMNSVFFGGDMNFLNTIAGIQNASSLYPCPFCIVSKKNLLQSPGAAKRSFSQHKIGEYSAINIPLFNNIYSNQLVPLPLHLFLGLGNKMVRVAKNSMKFIIRNNKRIAVTIRWNNKIVDNTKLNSSETEIVDNYIQRNIKQTRSQPKSKSSAVFELNGNELSSLLNKIDQFCELIPNEKRRNNIKQCLYWIKQLKPFLLSIDRFTTAGIMKFDHFVKLIQRDWTKLTKTKPFPKLHILTHAVEFARIHHYLGRYSESGIESHHTRVTEIATNHTNTANNEPVRLRRILSDLNTNNSYMVISSRLELNRKHCNKCGGIYAKDYNGEVGNDCKCAEEEEEEEEDEEEKKEKKRKILILYS